MKIKSISFGDIPFRMFRNLTINISERLTVIAGHNGIGKSTLLGLIANGSELKSSEGKTLLKRSFQAQLHELFYLDIARDYVKKSADKPYFTLTYSEQGKEDLTKICNVSKHSDKKQGIERLKVVPRGEQEGWNVGPSAKVPIPTMFLSMSRMLPNGEYQSSLNSELSKALSDEDKLYIREKFKAIIDNKVVDSDHITKQELKGTTKRSLLPEFEHSTRTISLGQDSLGVIITALASFAKLKRENPNYNGGILLIDEIDAGFHPRAQIKLIQLIKKEAKSLNLQIIMTSHSLTIIQEVLKINDETARSGRNIDSVVYIEDVLRPKLMEYPTYENIKGDMLGILPAFDDVTPHDYFRQVVIVFDNDVLLNDRIIPIMKESKTILALPAIIDNEVNNAELRTPEFQVFNYLSKLLENLEHPYWNNLPHRYNIELIKDSIIETFPMVAGQEPLRVTRKEWFKTNMIHFEQTNLMSYFYNDNIKVITPFINDFKTAIETLINK